MASVENTTKMVDEEEENVNQDVVSDVKKDENGSSVAVDVIANPVVESESVVGPTLGSNPVMIDINKEINGVSSGDIGDGYTDGVVGGDEKSNGVDVEGGKQGMVIGEKSESSNDAFRVGDFVWGKIKSHPWWPGQVYDPNDASPFAVKHSQEGRLLVAYFGDGSCSWCLPSQLVPFVENFAEMSTDSSSKSFHNAIQSAVNEIGRHVEYNMTCKCVPSEKKDALSRTVVSNAGVKAGVYAPEVDIRRLAVPEYDPARILEKLRTCARDVSVDSLLQLAVLKSWLSAFYCAKGGFQLAVHRDEPVYIEGLEDKNKTVSAVSDDFCVPIEVPILGPREDDWLSSPAVKSQASVDDKIYHRRKQKSVAELMAENVSVKSKSQKRAKVKKEENNVEVSASSRKKRKSDDGERKMSRKPKVEESEIESRKLTTDTDLSKDKSAGGVEEGASSGKPKQIEVVTAENTTGQGKEEVEILASPRERKKSKYLSPPYTNPTWATGNSSFKMKSESDKSTKMDRSSSPPPSKLVNDASDEELPIAQLKVLDTSSKTVENEKKLTYPVSDVDVKVDELLSEVQFGALDPLYLSKKGSLDTVWAFVSAHRSSTYVHGSDYKFYQKSKTGGKKRKSLSSQLKNQEKDIAYEKPKSAESKKPKAERVEDKKPDTSKSKKAAEFSRAKNSIDKLEANASTCLILKFAAEFPLPSKEEIVRLFAKFGSLNEKETVVLTDSHSVRIIYTNDSDAETAFKASVSESPFGVENVNYLLQHSSAGAKSRPKISLPALDKPGSSQPTDEFMTDVKVVKQKLEIMTAILENYHSKFSTEEKSSLKDEIKDLMENVETVSEKVRIMAEKASS